MVVINFAGDYCKTIKLRKYFNMSVFTITSELSRKRVIPKILNRLKISQNVLSRSITFVNRIQKYKNLFENTCFIYIDKLMTIH